MTMRCSKQRHQQLANVIGVCVDTRQPYVIVEFVDGQSLRDLLRRSTGNCCSWHQRVKLASDYHSILDEYHCSLTESYLLVFTVRAMLALY